MRKLTHSGRTRAAVVAAAWFASSVAAQPPRLELSVEPGSARGGEVTSIPIRLISLVGIRAAEFEINYDPAILRFRRVNPESVSAGRVDKVEPIRDGRVRVSLMSQEKIRGVEQLMSVEFEVLPGPAATTSIGLDSVRAWDWDSGAPVDTVYRSNDWSRVSGGGGPLERGLVVAYGLVATVALVAIFLVLSRRRSLKAIEAAR